LTTAATADEETGIGPVLPGLLVDSAWLADRLTTDGVRIVDLRDREAYAEEHIPGAIRLDLEALGENLEGCDNVLLSADDFERLMAELGISDRDSVVAYDDHWGLPSSRLIWALHHYGRGSAGVLNGGWDRWREEGRAMVKGPDAGGRVPERTHRFDVRPNPDVAADYERVSQGTVRGDIVLLDTRSAVEFDQGHLPGAISWDWFNAVPVNSWDCSRDPDSVRAELAELGVYPSDEIVAYCRSGMRVAHTWVVLRHAGFARVRLYDGSWQEWSMRTTLDIQGDS